MRQIKVILGGIRTLKVLLDQWVRRMYVLEKKNLSNEILCVLACQRASKLPTVKVLDLKKILFLVFEAMFY